MQDIRGVELKHGDPVLIAGYYKDLIPGWIFISPDKYPVFVYLGRVTAFLSDLDTSTEYFENYKARYKRRSYTVFGTSIIRHSRKSILKRDFDMGSYLDPADETNLVSIDRLFNECMMPYLEDLIDLEEMKRRASVIIHNCI